MAWRTLTEDDLRYYLSGPELQRLRQVGNQLGTPDPISGILTAASEYVRAYVKSVPLGPDGTLPPTLIYTAAQIAAWQCICWAGARGEIMDPKGLRKAQNDDAEEFLRNSVAKGGVALEAGEGGPSVYAVVAPSFGGRYTKDGRQDARVSEFGRENEDGM